MRIRNLVQAGHLSTLTLSILLATTAAHANNDLIELSKKDENWVMQTKNYNANNYSGMDQINTYNVKDLKVAWTFSTGTLNGHEGAPLVVDGIMYVHTPYPNNVFAIALNEPGKILWEFKPKQNPAARAVACCDVVN